MIQFEVGSGSMILLQTDEQTCPLLLASYSKRLENSLERIPTLSCTSMRNPSNVFPLSLRFSFEICKAL